MNFNNFIKLILVDMLKNDTILHDYASMDGSDRIDVTIGRLIVFPHPRTEAILKRIEESNEPINIEIPMNEYHYGFVSRESISVLDRFMEVRDDHYSYNPDGVRHILREATTLSSLDAFNSMSKIAKNIRTSKDTKINVRTWDDSFLNLEISDLVKAKLEIEMNNALFHMKDDSDDIIAFIKKNQEDFVMTSALLNDLKVSEYLLTLNARKREIIAFLSSDHMRTRMNRYLTAASTNLDEVINTSSEISFSKKPYVAFKKSLVMFASYMCLYPDITCRPGYAAMSLPAMSEFMNGMLHGYAVGDTLSAVLQRVQGVLVRDTHLISVLMQVMYRASLNNMELFDAVAELNDIFIEDARVSMLIRGNDTSNNRVIPIVEKEERSNKVEFVIREEVTMQDFIDGNVSSEAIGDYCAMYLAESIGHASDEDDKMSAWETIKYKTRSFNIDRKRKKYHVLLNEISKDISLVESGTAELLTVIEKNNLIRKAYALKAEIIKTRENAKSIEDEDLMELIDERLNYVDSVIAKIQGRNVRQERKGISFHLEKDMTDVLRASQGKSSDSNDTYE